MVMQTNGNGQGHVPAHDEFALRSQLFSLLGKSKTSEEQNLKALTQCASHVRNKMLVEKIAKSCNLTLSGFLFNDGLELYYDLKREADEMGNISRGWEDPGFRIGDLVTVPKSKADRFKACLPQIRKFCVVNGIGMTDDEAEESIGIYMDGVIYFEGFNEKTLVSTLDTLHECVEKAKELIG